MILVQLNSSIRSELKLYSESYAVSNTLTTDKAFGDDWAGVALRRQAGPEPKCRLAAPAKMLK